MADDPKPTQVLPRPAGRCRPGAHEDPVPFGQHVELGLVPSRSSTVIGGLMVALVVAALAVWAPASWLTVALGLLAAGILVCVVLQLALGHRGRCLLRRSIRWTFGPVGALLDPFETD